MNKFRVNLHPAFFDSIEKGKAPETADNSAELEAAKKAAIEQARIREQVLEESVRRNNEALASSVEQVEQDETTDKELAKQLKQLAKNKKIDFPWTDNAWKCSRAEKKLATSSAKVFQQLLDTWKLNDMIKKCKARKEDLTNQDAEAWKTELGINSKTKDIQNFYKAFKEYQNPQSQYQHLKNLMGFFCENDFSNIEGVREALQTRSQKISKADIERWAKALYQEWMQDGEYVIIDNKTGEKIDRKPKDWKQRASFEIIKDRLKNENSNTNKMLTLLWDFNLDGEVNSGDVGNKTWSQVVDVFRRVVATQHLKNPKFDDNSAVKNIVDYANKYGMDIKNVKTVDELYKWMTDNKKWYENTTTFQNFLRNLPVELEDVISNWAEAWQQSLNNLVSAIKFEKKIEADQEKLLELTAKQKAKEIVAAGESKLKETIKDEKERADITQKLLDQLPSMLISKTMEQNRGIAVGAAVELIKNVSGGFNVWIWPDGKPKFWLFLWWGQRFNLSDTTQLEAAVSAQNKLLFVPCTAASLVLSKDVNKGSRDKSLDAKWEHRVKIWGNVAITWWVFSYGFSAGVENNKKTGIEKQAQNINKVVKSQALERVKALKWAENKNFILKQALKEEFSKASEEDLDTATNNLLSIIQQFKIDEKTTEADFDIYAQVIADVYAEQWRSAAMAWIADNKRKISWWKVGIQFVAWCVPILSVVAKFTKYRNARTNETEHSRIARLDAQVNGQGNEQISLWDSKEIWDAQVKQINEILKRYGAKSWLKYIAWKDGKPGRIQVPAALADGIWINIRVSESMKWYVKESDWSYSFPANATYRLLQETGGNQRSITLNIGSDKSAPSDVVISDAGWMKKLLGNGELMWAKKLEFKPAESKSLEYNPDFGSLFTPAVIEWLKTIDSSNRKNFSEFMKTKKDAVDDFNKMVNAVINVLWKDKKYEAIRQKLLDKNTSPEDKQLIIDRIMAISATANVHDASWLNENLKLRKNYYKKETMKGPNWQSIFDKLSVNRDEFIKTLNGNYAMEARQNLLWATAFYNRNNSAKWLALTWLGATNVLWWKTQELTGDDIKKAEAWFLGWNNERSDYVPWALSEKSPQERDNLKRIIESRISNKISDKDLSDLLKKWEITLDNSQKKVKVKLDVKYVFYLMWECANESVGIELWDLQIQEQHEVEDYRQWALYLNNSDGTSAVSVSSQTIAAGLSAFWQSKNKGWEESYTIPRTEDRWEIDKTNPDATEITDPSAGDWQEWGGKIDLWW